MLMGCLLLCDICSIAFSLNSDFSRAKKSYLINTICKYGSTYVFCKKKRLRKGISFSKTLILSRLESNNMYCSEDIHKYSSDSQNPFSDIRIPNNNPYRRKVLPVGNVSFRFCNRYVFHLSRYLILPLEELQKAIRTRCSDCIPLHK